MNGPDTTRDPQELRSALQRAGATMSCPACDGREWVSSGAVELTSEPRTEVYLLSCKACGFVRMHDLDFLDQD
jgi:transcription elongation factor Elf1